MEDRSRWQTDRPVDSEFLAILRSNCGDSALTFDLSEPETYAHAPGYKASLFIRTNHWDGEHTHSITAMTQGMWLHHHKLVELSDHIIAWIRKPLDQLLSEPLSGVFELAELPEQHVRIEFCESDDHSSSLGMLVRVLIEAAAFRSQFHFVTDPSCLALFTEEMSARLKA